MHDVKSLETLSTAALTEETNSKAYKLALEMYLLGTPLSTIASALHCQPLLVKNWAHHFKWDTIKADSHTGAIALLADAAPVLLAQRAVSGLTKLIYTAVKEYDRKYAEGTLEITPRDLDRLTAVLTNLDKIVRLEQGKPTDIHSIQAISYEDARKILQDDPFAKEIVNASCREV